MEKVYRETMIGLKADKSSHDDKSCINGPQLVSPLGTPLASESLGRQAHQLGGREHCLHAGSKRAWHVGTVWEKVLCNLEARLTCVAG